MNIIQSAVSGTLESSDAQVAIEPGDGTVRIDLSSSVLNQYGRQIKEAITDTLMQLGVTSAAVTVVDKGALDCTLRARVSCAAYRAAAVSYTRHTCARH